jgi:hypothetical protein
VDRAAIALLEGVAMSTPVLPPFWSDVTQSDGTVLPSPPPIDLAQVTPSVGDVAALERTRTIHDDGSEVSTFDANTRPTDVEVTVLISQATDAVIGRLPLRVDTVWYASIRRAIALRAAQLVEVSYFREQATAGPAAAHATQFTSELQALLKTLPVASYIG